MSSAATRFGFMGWTLAKGGGHHIKESAPTDVQTL
jgi:hypothetical protein